MQTRKTLIFGNSVLRLIQYCAKKWPRCNSLVPTTLYRSRSYSPQRSHVGWDIKPQMRERKLYDLRAPSQCFFFCLFSFFFLLFFTHVILSVTGLAEDDVAVEHGLPLLLDLPPPALLGVLHLVQHVGSRVRARQHVVSVGERLLVLKESGEEKRRDGISPRGSIKKERWRCLQVWFPVWIIAGEAGVCY